MQCLIQTFMLLHNYIWQCTMHQMLHYKLVVHTHKQIYATTHVVCHPPTKDVLNANATFLGTEYVCGNCGISLCQIQRQVQYMWNEIF